MSRNYAKIGGERAINNNRIENTNCKDMDNEVQVNEVTKEESRRESIMIIVGVILIIIAAVIPILGIVVLFISISQNKKADVLGEFNKVADFASNNVHSSSNLRVNSAHIIREYAASSKNECISAISETAKETVKRRGYSEPFNVSPYIRNLPLNQRPSEEKLAYCLENGIILGENQTFVNGYTKGMNL